MLKLIDYFKWLFLKSKKSIPSIILLTSISGLFSWLSVEKALISKNLIDSATLSDMEGLKKWIIVLAILLLSQIVISGVQSILSTYCKTSLKNRIQDLLYKHIIHTKWASLNKFHSVDLLTRFSNDIEVIVNTVIVTIPQIIAFIVMFISSFYALLSLSRKMAFLSVVIFPVLIIFSKFYARKQKKYYLKIQKLQSKYNSFLQESFGNILIIKSFCLENRKKESLKTLQHNLLDLNIKKSYIGAVSSTLLAFSSMIGYFMVFVWGSYNLATGTIMFGSLTAMIQLFSNIQSPIYGLASALPQIISTLGSIDRIKELENMPTEDNLNKLLEKEAINSASEELSNDFTSKDLSNNSSLIAFNNVSFSYDNSTPVLKDISFAINKGDIIGLIGSSGGGKTTLIRLLLALISPDSGNILINNEELNITHRENFSYVPQGNTLFSGSILENLHFGNPNATKEDIEEALDIACASDFVSKLPNGIDTMIGEKGMGVSEGQAQRLTIARAILRKKPILILDEATSSLDPDTEVKVLNAINSLEHKPTCIIITHRPSALKICNKVYKLNNHSLLQNV